MQYLPLATQMLMPILIGVFLGKYLDNKFNGNGVYLGLTSFVFVVISIYLGIRDLIK